MSRSASKGIRGKNSILLENEKAKETRRANFAIAFFSEDGYPEEVSLLRDYGNNQIVCAIPADTYAQYQAVLATAVFLETTMAELNATELSALVRQCLNRRILGQINSMLRRKSG